MDNGVEIITVDTGNVAKQGFFCYKSKRKTEGFRRKLDWVEQRLAEASVREQQRVGRDLHDVLGQTLTALAFLSKALAEDLADQDLPHASDALRVCELANTATMQVRTLSRGMYPADLSEDSISSALHTLAEDAERLFGICCTVECPESIVIGQGTGRD